MRKLDARQIAREKSTFRYSSALERGDFSTVEMILQEAERDPLLAQMIAEINMVYESELIRLSPSHTGLNHSTNHHRKDLLMTTITLPAPQRQAQRWLPFTLVAACLSVLFIGALMLRPNPNDNWLAGIQGRPSETPTALPTLIPTLTATPFPAVSSDSTALPPTVVPPDVVGVVQPTMVMPLGICQITNHTGEPISLFAAPLTTNSDAVIVGEFAPNERATILYQDFDPASAPFAAMWYLIMTHGERNQQVTGWASANSIESLSTECVPTPVPSSVEFMLATPTPLSAGVAEFMLATPTPAYALGIVEPTVVPPADTIHPVFIGANTCKITTDTNVQVFTRPEGMVLEHVAPNTVVVVIDSQNVSNTGETWDYIMAAAYGTTLQGWVNSRLLQPFECPTVPEPVIGLPTAFPPTLVPPSDANVMPALPDATIPLATLVPPSDATLPMPVFVATPTAYFDSIMRDNPPAIILTQSVGSIAANTKVQITMAAYDGTQWTYQIRSNDGASEMIKEADLLKLISVNTINAVEVSGSNCTVVNTSDDSVPVYSGPSSDESESLLVNNLAPNTPAQLLYQQTGSDGSTWYLVLAVLDGGKQVSGWVSADGVQLVGQNCHTTR